MRDNAVCVYDNSKLNYMERLLSQKNVFIDTCSVLLKESDIFWENAIPILESYNSCIYIPSSVCYELRKIQEDKHKNPAIRKRARDVSGRLNTYINKSIVKVVGNLTRVLNAEQGEAIAVNDEHFADNELISGLMRISKKASTVVITQDKKLSSDILKMRRKGFICNALVKKIDRDGFLSDVVRNN